jgi:hypothetical protein
VAKHNTISRRQFIGATAALGAVGLSLDTEEVIAKAAESFHAARKRAGGPF